MEDKEQRILESAQKFFFRYGYKKTSLDEVAEDAGVAKGTIYNYFKNKEDLFIRNADCKQEEFRAEMEEELKQFTRADEKLIHSTLCLILRYIKLIKTYAMSIAVLEELVSVGMNLMSDHNKPEHVMRIAAFLKEGVAQGIFRSGDHEKDANLINQTMRMFFLRWANMDSESAETEIRDLYHLILNGLRC